MFVKVWLAYRGHCLSDRCWYDLSPYNERIISQASEAKPSYPKNATRKLHRLIVDHKSDLLGTIDTRTRYSSEATEYSSDLSTKMEPFVALKTMADATLKATEEVCESEATSRAIQEWWAELEASAEADRKRKEAECEINYTRSCCMDKCMEGYVFSYDSCVVFCASPEEKLMIVDQANMGRRWLPGRGFY